MDHRTCSTRPRGTTDVGENPPPETPSIESPQCSSTGMASASGDSQDPLDSEHVRRAVGEVAVPYGSCSEPSNVAAGGTDCPVRFRCVGCAHFSTDVSYLPDLEAYLADLLRMRERLLSAVVDADDWAKAEAMPSDEEITRVRRLIIPHQGRR